MSEVVRTGVVQASRYAVRVDNLPILILNEV